LSEDLRTLVESACEAACERQETENANLLRKTANEAYISPVFAFGIVILTLEIAIFKHEITIPGHEIAVP
jgi:hypothetical protein